MRALSVRSIPAFKELSALARITCAPTAALARERTRVSHARARRHKRARGAFARARAHTHTHTHLGLVVVVRLRVRLRWTLHSREVEGAGLADILVSVLSRRRMDVER